MGRLTTYLSFVRFSHTVFALPFALAGALLAARQVPAGWPTIGWILVAMVAARSAAMGFNRLADARLDALNPRTANREIPRGAMSTGEAGVFIAVSSIVFWYSLAKRYTTWTQLFLGLAMAVAPVGGWLAVGGRGGWEPWLLGLAIGAWVGGFDVLYACQDLEFDRAHGLRSIPVRFGVPASLAISRAMHFLAVISLGGLAWVTPLPVFYLAGVAVVALLLAYEQSLVRADDLSQVKRAFDLNGYVGILYFLILAASIWKEVRT